MFSARKLCIPIAFDLSTWGRKKLVFVVFSNETLAEHDGHVVDLAVRLVREMLDDLVVGINQHHVDGPVSSP